MRCKKINGSFQFRIQKKKKGSHLKRPQMHFGSIFEAYKDYMALSDSRVIELRDWLSRYINQYITPTPAGELVRTSRIRANQIIKNMDKLESSLPEEYKKDEK